MRHPHGRQLLVRCKQSKFPTPHYNRVHAFASYPFHFITKLFVYYAQNTISSLPTLLNFVWVDSEIISRAFSPLVFFRSYFGVIYKLFVGCVQHINLLFCVRFTWFKCCLCYGINYREYYFMFTNLDIDKKMLCVFMLCIWYNTRSTIDNSRSS